MKKRIDLDINTSFVLPCSSLESINFGKIRSHLKDNRKVVRHLLLDLYWDSLPEDLKTTLLQDEVGLIHTTWRQMKSISNKVTNYFLVSKKNWNTNEWQFLSKEERLGQKYFFLPNSYGHTDNFLPHEIEEICGIMRSIEPEVCFEYPYGIDAVDIRFSSHLQWTLIPDEIYTVNEVSSLSPAISIIIPFQNRNLFLRQVLTQLEKQTLASTQFEIILVDDGSIQSERCKNKALLSDFRSLAIKYIFVKKLFILSSFSIGNRAGPIRNLGVRYSKGSLLLFLDSDILLPANYLMTLLEEHKNWDVLIPKRVYLSKEASDQISHDISNISEKDVFEPPWYQYIKEFYTQSNWPAHPTPWKFCISYSLSMPRDLFLKSGGFRTNYISFGYEDLDLGKRIVRLTKKLKLLGIDVFHLYHFESGSEYSLDMNFRSFLLTMTSRMFYIQNLPTDAPYLLEMVRLKSKSQNWFFLLHKLLWKTLQLFLDFISFTKRVNLPYFKH